MMVSKVPLKPESKSLAKFSLGSVRKKPAPAILESICIYVRARTDAVRSTAIVVGDTPITDFFL